MDPLTKDQRPPHGNCTCPACAPNMQPAGAPDAPLSSNERLCAGCGFRIADGEHVRSFGFYLKHHSEAECVRLLKDEIERLRAALEKYGYHLDACLAPRVIESTCTCGWNDFDESLRELRPDAEGTP